MKKKTTQHTKKLLLNTNYLMRIAHTKKHKTRTETRKHKNTKQEQNQPVPDPTATGLLDCIQERI